MTGLMQAVKIDGKRLAVQMDDKWFSGILSSYPVLQEGDEATIRYKETTKDSRTYFDLVAVKKADEAATPSGPSSNGRILRSVALKAAAILYAGAGTSSIEAVLETADQMQQWLETPARGDQPTKNAA